MSLPTQNLLKMPRRSYIKQMFSVTDQSIFSQPGIETVEEAVEVEVDSVADEVVEAEVDSEETAVTLYATIATRRAT